MSSKRWREPPRPFRWYPSSQLQHGKRTWFGRHGKSRKLTLGDKQATCDRRWEDMDNEILIYIMKKYTWHQWGRTDFIVCKTWLSAFLDALFPPGNVLDLRLLDEYVNFAETDCGKWSEYARKIRIRKFLHYLKLNLHHRSPNHYTKLVLSECILHEKAYSGLAKRLPSLKSFVSPGKMSSYDTRFDMVSSTQSYFYVSRGMFRHWMYLEDVHCHYSMLQDLASCCKSVRNLTLVGKPGYRHWLPNYEASIIARGFPLLDHLGISAFVFSFTGISMILDGHKNLSYLDITHSSIVPDREMFRRLHYLIPLDYPLPKDLSHKIASVSTLLTCSRKNCPNCIYFDSRYDSITPKPRVFPPVNG